MIFMCGKIRPWANEVETQWEAFLPSTESTPNYCPKNDQIARHWINKLYSSTAIRLYSACRQLIRVGSDGDGGKLVCTDNINKENCVIYSLGSRLDFSFEIASIKELGCELHTFDCTVGEVKGSDIPDGVHFYPWCVGGKSERKVISSDLGHTGEMGQYYPIHEIMRKLGHERIDILKMDIERHELAVIRNLKRRSAPSQVVFETHLHNAYGLWNRPMTHKEWDNMWKKLAKLGYRIFSFETTPTGLCCSEWSIKM